MALFATACHNPSANWPQSFACIAQVWSGAARELFSNSWLNGARKQPDYATARLSTLMGHSC
jgi:hypothetical protein